MVVDFTKETETNVTDFAKDEEKELLKEVLRKLNILLDEKNGMKVSAMGMIANNTDAMIEKLDKIQKFLYFMEKRQLAMRQEYEKVNQLPVEPDKMNQ